MTKLFKITVSFGSVNSLISMPGAMSHASIPAEVTIGLDRVVFYCVVLYFIALYCAVLDSIGLDWIGLIYCIALLINWMCRIFLFDA